MRREIQEKENRFLQLRELLRGGEDERIALLGIFSLRSEEPKRAKKNPKPNNFGGIIVRRMESSLAFSDKKHRPTGMALHVVFNFI